METLGMNPRTPSASATKLQMRTTSCVMRTAALTSEIPASTATPGTFTPEAPASSDTRSPVRLRMLTEVRTLPEGSK